MFLFDVNFHIPKLGAYQINVTNRVNRKSLSLSHLFLKLGKNDAF